MSNVMRRCCQHMKKPSFDRRAFETVAARSAIRTHGRACCARAARPIGLPCRVSQSTPYPLAPRECSRFPLPPSGLNTGTAAFICRGEARVQVTVSWRDHRALRVAAHNPAVERTSNGGPQWVAQQRSATPLAAAHLYVRPHAGGNAMRARPCSPAETAPVRKGLWHWRTPLNTNTALPRGPSRESGAVVRSSPSSATQHARTSLCAIA